MLGAYLLVMGFMTLIQRATRMPAKTPMRRAHVGDRYAENGVPRAIPPLMEPKRTVSRGS